MFSEFRSILVPTDFSPSSWNAMQLGIELGQMYGASLTVLHILSANERSDEKRQFELFDQLEKVRSNMEKLSNELIADNTMEVSNLVMVGNVNKILLSFIEKHNFDLVIMGTNSSGLNNTPGTHTIEVIENSKHPVLVVPNSYRKD